MKARKTVISKKIEWRSIASLRADPRNARIHSKKQIRQIANSIKALGFVGAALIDENGTLLAGHARLEAAKLLDMDLVPTLQVTGLSEAQKRAFALADNKIGENAGWDREFLVRELGELATLLEPLHWDLTLTGFEAAEIDALFADLEVGTPDPVDTPLPVDKHAASRPGDLWVLGRHRLLCGDARSRSDLDRVMDGVRARMVFTDPPYNVRIADVQGRGRIKHPEFAYASGEMSELQYTAFLEEALGNAARVSTDDAIHYVFSDWRHVVELGTVARRVYGAMLNLCVWAKTSAGQGSFYRSQHELVGVFQVGQNGHQNNIRLGRNRSNLWTYAGMNSFGADRQGLLATHPTVKPITLVADAMRDCTTKGDVVLDPFLGSGTTILASEKVGRSGYGLECESKYVDVTIRRWEAYTKAEAVLDGDGRTYAEVKAERLAAPDEIEPQTAIDPRVSQADRTPATADAEGDGGDWATLCEGVSVTPAIGECK
jgi:DNA modification methylase